MKHFLISFLSRKTDKKLKSSKININILLLLCLITTYNSLSTEIKIFSIPYSTLLSISEISKIRNLSEQYIFGSAFKINYYYSNIYIGEDMERQGLILDTGSSITTSTCSPLCQHCGNHISPPYDIKSKKKIISCFEPKCKIVSSNCYSNINISCPFNIKYAEGSSISGVFINELIRFGENYKEQNGTYIPIGCTMNENHLFYKQEANGIMGLINNDYNFINLLYKFGAINKNIFSLCYAQLGGVFSIGEINYKLHKEKVIFVPMLKEEDKYFGLNVKSILVNNKKLVSYKENDYHPFIDSGSTISYFDNKIYDEILKLTLENCAKFNKSNACGKYEYNPIFDHCFYFENTDILNFAVKNYWPTIHFILDGYDFKWYPENYIFNITDNNRTGACMGFAKNYGKVIKFGGSWIIGHDIIFDRENNLLGFAEADCYQNKNLNLTNGLELNITYNKKEKFVYNNSYISNKNNISTKKKSLDLIIFGSIFLVLKIFIILLIILKFKKEIGIDNKTIKSKNSYLNNEINSKTEHYIKISIDY